MFCGMRRGGRLGRVARNVKRCAVLERPWSCGKNDKGQSPTGDDGSLARKATRSEVSQRLLPSLVMALKEQYGRGIRQGVAEVLSLRWRNIGANAIHLAGDKAGPPPVGSSMRCPRAATPVSSRSRITPRTGRAKAGFFTDGMRSAPASPGRGFTTFDTSWPAMPSCPARTCAWWGSCSDTAATLPPLAMLTWPTITW